MYRSLNIILKNYFQRYWAQTTNWSLQSTYLLPPMLQFFPSTVLLFFLMPLYLVIDVVKTILFNFNKNFIDLVQKPSRFEVIHSAPTPSGKYAIIKSSASFIILSRNWKQSFPIYNLVPYNEILNNEAIITYPDYYYVGYINDKIAGDRSGKKFNMLLHRLSYCLCNR